jgi:tetratricopeptide (TPR) repeat protein
MMHNSRSYRFVITKDGFKTLDHLEEPGLKRPSFNAPISKDFRLTSGYEVVSGNDSNDGSGALGAGKGPEAYNLGVKALEDDDLENAKLAFLEAVEDSPGFALAHAALASVLCELEEFEEAVTAAKKAVVLEANVRSLEILHRAGRGGEDDEAIGLALQGLAERRPDKTTARMFYNDGVTAFEAEVYDRAELRFRTALEIEPGLREAGRALGRVYLKQGKYQEAKAEAERLVEVDRYDLEALDVLQRARDALLDEG